MTGSSESVGREELEFRAALTLRRLEPRLDQIWGARGVDAAKRHEYELRLERHFRPLFGLLFQLYGSRCCPWGKSGGC